MNTEEITVHLEDFNFSIEEVKSIVNLPEFKVMNVYIYGSRVYGTNGIDSDVDCLVVANSLDAHKEIRNNKYNIHIYTPDRFWDFLLDYRMVNLECIYAPSFAIVQERIKYGINKIDVVKLKRSVLKQSRDSWVKSKMKFNEMDIQRAVKSLFHSLRMLHFGTQIVENGKIIDFSVANEYWNEISHIEEYRWTYFKEKYLPLKRKLENILIESKTIDV